MEERISTSFTWVKRVTEIGFMLMSQKARAERMEGVVNGSTINAGALANLINECTASAGAFVEKNDDRVKSEDAELINSLLGRIDAEKVVSSVDPDELTEWVLDLKRSCTT